MKAKKQFGQHFLTHDHYAKIMVESAQISKSDVAVEIGPGKGILTNILLSKAKKVIAVEKDRDLIPILKNNFAHEIKNKKIELKEKDIRDFNPPTKYKLVANIPYYITGEILRIFLERKNQPLSMTLLVQKEVAERIIARDGKESLLSISVKAFGDPKIIAKVSRGNFSPPPKVDSAILQIENISKNFFKKIDEKKFFELLHAGFAHKRKVLISNLLSLSNRETLEKIFAKNKIKLTARAENISLTEWKKIITQLN